MPFSKISQKVMHAEVELQRPWRLNSLDQRCPDLSQIAKCGDKPFKCDKKVNLIGQSSD